MPPLPPRGGGGGGGVYPLTHAEMQWMTPSMAGLAARAGSTARSAAPGTRTSGRPRDGGGAAARRTRRARRRHFPAARADRRVRPRLPVQQGGPDREDALEDAPAELAPPLAQGRVRRDAPRQPAVEARRRGPPLRRRRGRGALPLPDRQRADERPTNSPSSARRATSSPSARSPSSAARRAPSPSSLSAPTTSCRSTAPTSSAPSSLRRWKRRRKKRGERGAAQGPRPPRRRPARRLRARRRRARRRAPAMRTTAPALLPRRRPRGLPKTGRPRRRRRRSARRRARRPPARSRVGDSAATGGGRLDGGEGGGGGGAEVGGVCRYKSMFMTKEDRKREAEKDAKNYAARNPNEPQLAVVV